MRILKSSLKCHELVLAVTNPEDFWYLSHIIDKNDIVTARTFRKIKLGSPDERSQNIIKKPVTLTITVEKTEVTGNELRISGRINNDIEDIKKGSFHTISLEVNSTLTIKKPKWLKFQLDKIKESSFNPPNVLIIALDRDQASFALLKKYCYEYLTDIYGEVSKKLMKEQVKNTFYNDVINQIKEYNSRYNFQNIILASPSFWKEYVINEIKDKALKNKIILATCYSVGRTGINEIINRDEIKNILKNERIIEETRLIEELLKEISKDSLATYGIKYVREAALSGAVKDLLITDSLIQKFRDENKYNEIDEIMSLVESSSGNINIISSEHEAGKKLNGLTGIAAILRYKLKY